jgi:hypothetical protein
VKKDTFVAFKNRREGKHRHFFPNKMQPTPLTFQEQRLPEDYPVILTERLSLNQSGNRMLGNTHKYCMMY